MKLCNLLHHTVLVVGLIASPLALAEKYASAAEAEAIVKKAGTHIKSIGAEKAYEDFTSKRPPWVDRDLYVVVYDLQGKVRAHGQNPKMVGKDLIDLKDPDGKEFVRERVELATSKGKFWQDYKFTDPVTKKILPKSMYCEKVDDTAVCAGVYKR
jgi:signal transduction histidine kinase